MDPWIIWFVVGTGLIVSEFFVPGVILVFFGMAAWLVAGLSFLGITTSTPLQLVVFAGASLFLTGTFRRIFMQRLLGKPSTLPGGSDHEDEFVGKAVKILTSFDRPGAMGKVEFKGAEWNARAEEELHPEDTAEIASVDGITLNIRRQWLTHLP